MITNHFQESDEDKITPAPLSHPIEANKLKLLMSLLEADLLVKPTSGKSGNEVTKKQVGWAVTRPDDEVIAVVEGTGGQFVELEPKDVKRLFRKEDAVAAYAAGNRNADGHPIMPSYYLDLRLRQERHTAELVSDARSFFATHGPVSQRFQNTRDCFNAFINAYPRWNDLPLYKQLFGREYTLYCNPRATSAQPSGKNKTKKRKRRKLG